MSARVVLAAAVAARLRAEPALGGVAVFDAPPVRAVFPYAVVEEAVFAAWGSKTWAGREARFAVLLWDAGERPTRLRELMGAVDEAAEELPVALGQGWRTASARVVRSRIARAPPDRWVGSVEMVVRMWREDG